MTNVPATPIPQSGLVAVAPVWSVADTEKLKFPTAVGVPLITPVSGFKVRPGGKAPLAIANV
jgi:hypothetical protein